MQQTQPKKPSISRFLFILQRVILWALMIASVGLLWQMFQVYKQVQALGGYAPTGRDCPIEIAQAISIPEYERTSHILLAQSGRSLEEEIRRDIQNELQEEKQEIKENIQDQIERELFGESQGGGGSSGGASDFFNTQRDPFGTDELERNIPLGDVNLMELIGNLINLALSFVAIILLLMILYSGFLYLVSGSDEDRRDKAKKTFINALIGVVIIFLSGALVRFVFNALQGATGTDGGDVPF